MKLNLLGSAVLAATITACVSVDESNENTSQPVAGDGENTVVAATDNVDDNTTPARETYPLPAIDRLPADFAHGGLARDPATIDMIVIHTIGGPACVDGEIRFGRPQQSAVFWRDWFTEQNNKSIHYIVDRQGAIAQQRPENRTAGHVSFGGVMPNVNRRSIGIELVNNGDGIDPFPEVQLQSLIALLQDIAARRTLGADAIWAHSALDTRTQAACDNFPRNVDPNDAFPMARIKAAMPPA